MENLQNVALTLRKDIVTMIHKAKSGHPGGSLSAVELMTALYFSDIFRCDPTNPDWEDRDRFILSKGHVAPVIYSVLARKGFFDVAHLDQLRQFGSILQGHPNRKKTPGFDCSSGSLGQGLSISNGIAFALKRRGSTARTYCLLGDGELQEGQCWEAIMFAAQHKLSNVCAMVDCNHIQLDGSVEEIKNIYPLAEKWADFGWNVICVDGHDVQAVYLAYQQAAACSEIPSVILAETIKGKGISYMENAAKWHGTAPDAAQYAIAMAELKGE